jgi:hypothetical protein
MMILRILSLAALLFACALPALAQEPARASLSVERSLSIASVRPIQLSPDDPVATLSMRADIRPDAPAVIRIAGDPGRLYRIRVPRTLASSEGVILVEDLQIWSENTGDISKSRTSRMDFEGRDLLHVSGRLRPPTGAGEPIAALPLSIDYD